MCHSLFFDKVAGLRPAEILWHRCFPVNFEKFPRTAFIIEHLPWLLLTACRYLLFFLFSSTNIHESKDCREGISVTPHYHFHPIDRHLDISRAITAEN